MDTSLLNESRLSRSDTNWADTDAQEGYRCLEKRRREYSLHKLGSELVLAMEFDEARRYVATGEMPEGK